MLVSKLILADLLADLPPPPMHHGIYLMGCIWQPFWILQEKVGISFYFWIIRVVNSQHGTVMSDVTPLTPLIPWNTPKTPHMTITNFNYESSYLPSVICNIVVKADLGRWTPLGNRTEMPWIPVHQNWQTNLLWPMDPPWIEHRCLEYCYTKLGRWTYFGWWTPPVNQE